MQPAPAVSLPCGDAGGWRGCGIALTAATAAVLAAWGLGWAGAGIPSTLSLAGLAGGVAAAIHARRAPFADGILRWDAQTWQWLETVDAAARPGEVQVAIDLGGWMLLRFRPADGAPPRWLPVGAAAGAPARTALFAADRSAPAPAPAA